MKEAYGGATNIYLFLFFFVVYVSFLAFALQFAKAYRVKNYVIDVLEQEQYDGKAIDGGTNTEIANKLYGYFSSIPYTGVDKIAEDFCKVNSDNDTYTANSYEGACIIKYGEDEAPYYKVFTFVDFSLPLLDVDLKIPVGGETMIIKNNSK